MISQQNILARGHIDLQLWIPSDSELFRRGILMSGSGYSPWAVVEAPEQFARQAADQLGCAAAQDLYACARNKSVSDILAVSAVSDIYQ